MRFDWKKLAAHRPQGSLLEGRTEVPLNCFLLRIGSRLLAHIVFELGGYLFLGVKVVSLHIGVFFVRSGQIVLTLILFGRPDLEDLGQLVDAGF